MARDPAQDIQIEEAVKPQTEIIDHYIQPQKVAKSPLWETAKALSNLSDDLGSAFTAMDKNTKEAAIEEGKARYWEMNKDGASEMTMKGAIPFQANPYVRQGFDQTAGHNDGIGLSQKIGPDYETLDKTNLDPGHFENWFRGWVQNQTPKDENGQPVGRSKDYLKGWAPQVQVLHDAYQQKFVKDQSEAVKFGVTNGLTKQLDNEVDAQYLTNNGKPSLDQLGQSLDAIRERAYSMGIEKKAADDLVIKSVTAAAIRYKDPTLLNALDYAKSGASNPDLVNNPNGVPLSNTEEGRLQKMTVGAHVQTLIHQDELRQRERDQFKIKQDSNVMQTSVINKLVKDPTYQPTQEELTAINKTDPEFLTKIGDYRTKIVNRNMIEDETVLQGVQEQIFAGKGVAAITGNLDRLGPKQIPKALELLNTFEKYNETGGMARGLETPTAKQALTILENASKDPKWAGSLFAGQGVTPAGRAAINDYRMNVMQWELAHPKANPIERQQYQSALTESILGRITAAGGGDNGEFRATYTQPPSNTQEFGLPLGESLHPIAKPDAATPGGGATGQSGTGPAPSGTAPAATGPQPFEYNNPAAAKAAPAPVTPPNWYTKVITSPTPPKMQELGLKPDQEQFLREQAAKRGIDPQVFIDRLHGAAQSNRPQPTKPGFAKPEQRSDAGGDILSPTPAAYQSADIMNSDHPVVRQATNLFKNLGLDPSNMDLSQITPENAARIKAAIEQHAPGIMQRASLTTSGDSGMAVSPNRVAQIDASPIKPIVEAAATTHGFDANKLKAIVSIESGGRPSATTGSYKGLLQLSDAEFAKYGRAGGDIMDPKDNLEAGIKSLQDKEAKFKTQYGREPSATELYLMHQQGEAGLRAHLNNPEQPAWKSMASTGEGKQKGDRWAKQAIWGNVPTDVRSQFGSVDNITSADFVAVWMHKLQGIPMAEAKKIVAGNRSKTQET